MNFIGPSGKWYQDLYAAKYKERFRSAYNGYLFDAVSMAAQAVTKAGSTDAAKIVAAAHQLDYDGATGHIPLDADGERARQDYLFATVKDGDVVPA